jgi:hypothetical protein
MFIPPAGGTAGATPICANVVAENKNAISKKLMATLTRDHKFLQVVNVVINPFIINFYFSFQYFQRVNTNTTDKKFQRVEIISKGKKGKKNLQNQTLGSTVE